jgi:sorbitol-specific phosphotransferase system component IIBC
VPIPYPKREFIVDEDSADAGAAAHAIKTEPVTVVKTEPASAMHSQQQQQQQQQQQTLAHMKQQASHNNLPQMQQVSRGIESFVSTLFVWDLDEIGSTATATATATAAATTTTACVQPQWSRATSREENPCLW